MHLLQILGGCLFYFPNYSAMLCQMKEKGKEKCRANCFLKTFIFLFILLDVIRF